MLKFMRSIILGIELSVQASDGMNFYSNGDHNTEHSAMLRTQLQHRWFGRVLISNVAVSKAGRPAPAGNWRAGHWRAKRSKHLARTRMDANPFLNPSNMAGSS